MKYLLRLLSLISLLALFLVGCYRPSETTDQNTLGSTFTLGVILSGSLTDYGWSGDPIAGTNYTVTSIENHRVLLLPLGDQTLDSAINGLVDSGARVIFLSSNLGEAAEQHPDIILIRNLSTRENVARLLPGLASVASDTARFNPAPQPMDQNSDTGLMFCTILASGMVLVLLTVLVAARRYRRPRHSQSVVERLITRIQTMDGDKPKKKRGSSKAGIQSKRLAIEDFAMQQCTDFAARGEPAPVLHRLSTYIREDLWFDDSFSIERDKTFLGECGVGIAKIPNTTHSGVLEIWLFDKNDIRTQTATLIASGTILDSTRRSRLEKKGSIIEARPDAAFELETKTLRLRARVLEMQTALDEANFPNHAFEHIVIELAVWEVPTAGLSGSSG